MKVRKAHQDDFPAILLLWQDFMAHIKSVNTDYYDLKSDGQEFLNHLVSEIQKSTTLIVVAEKEGVILGFSLAYIDQLPSWFAESQIGLIRYVAVSADAQGKGVGKQMFDFMKTWFQQNDINRIELYILDGLAATDFWEHLGFKKLMDRRFLEI